MFGAKLRFRYHVHRSYAPHGRGDFIKENAIANAEYVIEGEIQPGVKVIEDQNTHTGYAMPEFPGYNGVASHECWLIKVKAVTHRKNPIMQTVIGPSEEQNLAGIPTEASIYNMIEKALSAMGIRIVPPMVSFYQGYKTIEEWTNNFVERLLGMMGLQNSMQAWNGM